MDDQQSADEQTIENLNKRKRDAYEFCKNNPTCIKKEVAATFKITMRQLGTIIESNGVVKSRGRQPYLTAEGVKSLCNDLTQRSIQLDSCVDLREAVYNACINQETILRTPRRDIHKTTLRNIAKKNNITTGRAVRKSDKRLQHAKNIRNPISCCALMDSILLMTNPELIINTDEFYIVVNSMDEKVTAFTTREATKYLKANNLALSALSKPEQRRSFHFSCSVTAAGKLLCSVLRIVDVTFNEEWSNGIVEKPKVFKMSDETESPFYIICQSTESAEERVQQVIYEQCIIPCARKLRKNLIKAYCNQSNSIVYTVNTQQTVQTNDGFEIDYQGNEIMNVGELTMKEKAESKYHSITLLCDGALPQINTILENVLKHYKDKEYKLVFGKYAAGCSMLQQANDQGHMHKIAKRKFSHYKSNINVSLEDHPKYKKLKKKLERSKLLQGSKNVIWDFILSATNVISQSFTPSNIITAFELAGTVVFDENKRATSDHERILNHCSHYLSLDEDQQAFVKSKIPILTEKMQDNGFIRTQDFNEELIAVDGVDNGRHLEDNLDELCTSRQRCMIFNHLHWLKILEERKNQNGHDINTIDDEDDGLLRSVGGKASKKKKKPKIQCLQCKVEANKSNNNNNSSSSSSSSSSSNNRNFADWIKCAHCGKLICANPICVQWFNEHKRKCYEEKNPIPLNNKQNSRKKQRVT